MCTDGGIPLILSPSDTDQSLEALLNRIGVFSTTDKAAVLGLDPGKFTVR